MLLLLLSLLVPLLVPLVLVLVLGRVPDARAFIRGPRRCRMGRRRRGWWSDRTRRPPLVPLPRLLRRRHRHRRMLSSEVRGIRTGRDAGAAASRGARAGIALCNKRNGKFRSVWGAEEMKRFDSIQIPSASKVYEYGIFLFLFVCATLYLWFRPLARWSYMHPVSTSPPYYCYYYPSYHSTSLHIIVRTPPFNTSQFFLAFDQDHE